MLNDPENVAIRSSMLENIWVDGLVLACCGQSFGADALVTEEN